MKGTDGIANKKKTTRKTYVRWHDNIKMDLNDIVLDDVN
jgi:hypothetical protein